MTLNAPQSLAWPLIFSYRGTILGNGFVAEINLQGRVLAVPESAGVWVYGVHPGAIAVSAPTLDATNVELRNTLTRLFIDFAQEASAFDQFKEAVERFLNESDTTTESEWQTVRAAVKDGRIAGPGDLPRYTDDSPYFVEVKQKQINAVTPQDNLLVQQESPQVYATAA